MDRILLPPPSNVTNWSRRLSPRYDSSGTAVLRHHGALVTVITAHRRHLFRAGEGLAGVEGGQSKHREEDENKERKKKTTAKINAK